LTQGQLAARAGVSHKLIGEIERGIANPTIDTLGHLSEALDLEVGDFFANLTGAAGRHVTTSEMERVQDSVALLTEVLGRREDSSTRKRAIRRG